MWLKKVREERCFMDAADTLNAIRYFGISPLTKNVLNAEAYCWSPKANKINMFAQTVNAVIKSRGRYNGVSCNNHSSGKKRF